MITIKEIKDRVRFLKKEQKEVRRGRSCFKAFN